MRPIKIMGSFIVIWSRLLPAILFSIVFLPSPTLASIRRDVDSGIHYFCYDGYSSVYTTMKGYGSGLRGNGSSLPIQEGVWTPSAQVPGCYYREMSSATRNYFIQYIYKNCVQLRRNCFRVDP